MAGIAAALGHTMALFGLFTEPIDLSPTKAACGASAARPFELPPDLRCSLWFEVAARSAAGKELSSMPTAMWSGADWMPGNRNPATTRRPRGGRDTCSLDGTAAPSCSITGVTAWGLDGGPGPGRSRTRF